MKSLFLLVLSCLSCHSAVIRDLAYVEGGHERQKLDLHLPANKGKGGAPVLIAIHGGAWAFGDKANFGFAKPKFQWFNEQGFIVASINYRLSPAVTHPSHIEDVCQAVAWVEDHIAKHGGDPKKIYLIGHSAGAHLAALVAVDEKRLKVAGGNPESIKGVILLDGAAYHVPKQVATSFRKDNMFSRAFTHDKKTQQDASPTLKVALMNGTPPPYLILHVANRKESRSQSEELAEALKAKGGKAEVLAIEGKTHGSINRDMGKEGDATTTAVAKFLKSIE